jgi:hypothetical protein
MNAHFGLLPGPAGAALACCLLALAPAATATATEPLPAVWQKHEYSFTFMGFTAVYSCDGLADDLKRLLIAAGARADAKAVPKACEGGFGRPAKLAGAYLTFFTLAAPGPATRDESGGAPPAESLGVWRSVEFVTHSPSGTGPLNLALGSCELVEQFRKELLPMFTTRGVLDKTVCVPHQLSGSGIDLRFEALAPLPAGEAAAAVLPASPPGKDFIIYPKNGQSPEQTDRDRGECHRWAANQTGYDPTHPPSGMTSEQTTSKHADYRRAMSACLVGRGYSVQ